MKILCAGEALIDFISMEKGKKLSQVNTFKKRPGGAPFNVAVALSRLKNRVSFLSRISSDSFGSFLIDFMKREGIDTSNVVIDHLHHTTLAFVSIDEGGKPDFEFYGENSADSNLTLDDIKDLKIDEFSAFHFGSISLVRDPTSKTLLDLFERFVGKVLTFFDPNVRASLIKSRDEFLERIEPVLRKADIVKLSEEDLAYLGYEDLEEFVRDFGREGKMTFLTLGKEGSVGYFKGKIYRVKAFVDGEVVDTTGCGDAYMAGLIHVLVRGGDGEEAMEFANRLAGVVATRYGAASAMPRVEEL